MTGERGGGRWEGMPKKSPKQLFRKLFYRYTVLTVLIVTALTIYFLSATRSEALETRLDYQRMMAEKTADYLTDCGGAVNFIHADLYQSAGVLEDLLHYFGSTDEEYQRYRLDTYSDSAALAYEGFDDYMKDAMKAYPDITSVELISYKPARVTVCHPDGRVTIGKGAETRVQAAEAGRLAEWGQFAFVKEIRDPDTLAGVGCMIVNFGTTQLARLQEYYGPGELLVCDGYGTAVFHSEARDTAEPIGGAEFGRAEDPGEAETAPGAESGTEGGLAERETAPGAESGTEGDLAGRETAPGAGSGAEGDLAGRETAPGAGSGAEGGLAEREAAPGAGSGTEGKVSGSGEAPEPQETLYTAADMAARALTGGRTTAETEKLLHIYLHRTEAQDYTVCAYLDKSKAASVPVSQTAAIGGVGLGMLLLGVYAIRSYLMRLNGRLNGIIDGMHRVTTGDLEVRLETQESGDELDMISAHFNEMCTELDRYIQKSYLAEIEQKNAELEALQNQINPHFLYNTLEAIRMKAICNGDREVGKMLYSMAVIFRSQLKEDDWIPVIQELHYCKKYLELFEYRYQGKFISQVECPEELMDLRVMKFILQPVIENYFIHGIRSELQGNTIHIWVARERDALLLHVEDNGKGMCGEELARKNRELEMNSSRDRRTIGITNVNRRIQAVCGAPYGVKLEKGREGGLHVILRVGIRLRENKGSGDAQEQSASH